MLRWCNAHFRDYQRCFQPYKTLSQLQSTSQGRVVIAIIWLLEKLLLFFPIFHFGNKALTYCITTVPLWCVYHWVMCHEVPVLQHLYQSSKALGDKSTFCSNTFTSNCWCDLISAWHSVISYYWFWVQKWMAKGLPSLKWEVAQNSSRNGQVPLEVGNAQSKAKHSVSHHTLSKPRIAALLTATSDWS